jgi:hypothetical protein
MPAYSQSAARVGTLELNNMLLMPSAFFKVRNPQVLWLPAPKRGNDIIIPGKDGVLGRSRRKTSRTVTLEVFINGTVSAFANDSGATGVALQDNLKFLRGSVFDDSQSDPFDIEYTAPGESKVTRKGQVLSLEEVDTDPRATWMLVELDLIIFAGEIVEQGS